MRRASSAPYCIDIARQNALCVSPVRRLQNRPDAQDGPRKLPSAGLAALINANRR